MTTLRYYQKECVDEMQRRNNDSIASDKMQRRDTSNYETSSSIHVLQLFCGTGKTRIYTHFIEENIRDIVVIAFPRIALLHQYYDDYYCKSKRLEENYDLLIVSADHNNKESLHSFISKSKSKSKLILVTHTSFEEIITMLPKKPDLIIIDEFHHFNTQKKMQFLFDITKSSSKNTIVFGFTATPHKLHIEYIIYKYGYFEALRDGNCKNFEVDLYITPDIKTPDNLYKSLFYLAEKSRIKNILCFHSLSEVSGKGNRSSVADYVNIRADLNYKNSYFTEGIESHTITGTMKNDARLFILNTIADASDKKLSIVHTCNTVSEGIDTKSIKSICFVDAKGSAISIIQCIGRITRLDENNDEPSRVLIPFFEVNYDKSTFSGRGSIANCVSIDDSDDDDDDSSEDNSPIISKTEDDLINESGYKTIMGVVSFLRKDNPALFNAAIANPKIITKMEYDFHFEKIIVNKSKGDMYVGKNIEDIKESNVIICSSELGGEVYEIDDFFSDRNVSKETDVDEWIYLYTDKSNKVIDTLGSSKRKPYKMTKPKKPLVVCGTDDADKFFEELVREKVNKSRMEKIVDMCKWIRSEKRLPIGRDKMFGSFFNGIRNTKKGTAKNNSYISEEEELYLSTLFKTKDWHLISNTIFQNYINEWLDPNIKEIEYTAPTRLDKIKNLCDWIKENNAIPAAVNKEWGGFFNDIRNIKKGKSIGGIPISDDENEYLSNFFKTEKWHLLSTSIFQNHINEWLDDTIEELNIIDKGTRLDKIKDLCDWILENKAIPQKKDRGLYGFFNDIKSIKKEKSKNKNGITDDEDNYLSTFFKTKSWYLLSNPIFQDYIEEWLDPNIKEIDYKEITRLDKIKSLCLWITENKAIPTAANKECSMFFVTIKSIKRGTATRGNPISDEEDKYLSAFFKTKDWSLLNNEIFQKHIEEWLDPTIKEIDYKEITRLDKIKPLCRWITENKAIPATTNKEYGVFFSTIKTVKRGTQSGSPILDEEDSYLSVFFKTEQWYLINNTNFQPKLNDWLNPDIKIVDYDFSKVRGANEIDISPSKVKIKAEVKPPPNMKEEIKNNTSFIFTPENRYDKACKELLDSYFENNDEKGKKRLIDLQKIKSGTKKSGSKLYETIDNYLMSLHEKWETVTLEELVACYKNNIESSHQQSTSEIKHVKEHDEHKVSSRESMPKAVPIKDSPIISVTLIDDNNNEDCKDSKEDSYTKTLILGGTKESSLTNKIIPPKKNYGLNMKDIIVLNKFYKTKDPNLLSDIATIYESNEEGCLAFFEKKGISEEELVSYFLQ